MTTQKSLSLPKMKTTAEMDEEIEEIVPSSHSFGTLPDVVLQHLIPFLKWNSRRSLSQVNSRFRDHYFTSLREAKSLSVKGQISVGVGEKDQQNVSFISEFYTIRIEMDEEVVVEWTLKLESGIRTVINTHYDGNAMTMETTESVLLSSRDYLEKKMKWILEHFEFKKIHLGVPGLAHLFNSYKHRVLEVGVSDDIEYLQLAERLRPKKLALFQGTQNRYNRGTLNLTKFPQLEELRMYGVPLDLDQLVESRLLRVQADTIENNIKLKHAKKMIQNWKSGNLNYKEIQISCEPNRIPIRVPYNIWSELNDEDIDEYYDNIENNQHKTGSFRYSSRSFQFVSWEQNDGKEPNMYSFHY